MKKITAFILAAVLLLSLGVFALADGTTTLTTTVPAATYTLTIPQDVKVTYGTGWVYVENLDAEATSGFAVGKNLKVTVNYTPFVCEGVSTTIPYSVSGGLKYSQTQGDKVYGSIANGDSLIFTCTGTNAIYPTDKQGATKFSTGSSTYNYVYYNFSLSFNNSDWGKALAGDYTATMTFTSEIVAAES